MSGGAAQMTLGIHPADLRKVVEVLLEAPGVRFEKSARKPAQNWGAYAKRMRSLARRCRRLVEASGIQAEEDDGRSEDVDPEAMEADLSEWEAALEDWRKRERRLRRERDALRRRADTVRWLEAAGLRPGRLRSVERIDLRVAWVPSGQLKKLDLRFLQAPMVLVPLLEHEEKTLTAAASLPDDGFVLGRVLGSLFAEVLFPAPEDEGPVTAEREVRRRRGEIEEDIQQVRLERRERIEAWRKRLKSWRPRLERESRIADTVARYAEPAERFRFRIAVADTDAEPILSDIENAAQRPFAAYVVGPSGGPAVGGTRM